MATAAFRTSYFTPVKLGVNTSIAVFLPQIKPVISGARQSNESAKVGFLEKEKSEVGKRVGEFRKKLKIADIKGGPDEGLDRVGKTIVVMGWVRTLRVQSSVTFIEVNDGSCLSNMQCVMGLEAEGYDQ
ncbi:ASPARTYL/LYSYL-TRNA SYNTHETASE, partial [Salix koriyanagi]